MNEEKVSSSNQQYEFSYNENKIILSLAKFIMLSGALTILITLLIFWKENFFGAFIVFLPIDILCLYFIYTGYFLHKIGLTEGSDISYLILAIKKLRISFIVYFILVLFMAFVILNS